MQLRSGQQVCPPEESTKIAPIVSRPMTPSTPRRVRIFATDSPRGTKRRRLFDENVLPPTPQSGGNKRRVDQLQSRRVVQLVSPSSVRVKRLSMTPSRQRASPYGDENSIGKATDLAITRPNLIGKGFEAITGTLAKRGLNARVEGSPYSAVRAVLRRGIAETSALVGRERESASISRFVLEGSARCLFIGGPTGTGKTCTTSKTLEQIPNARTYTICCTTLVNAGAVFARIADCLGLSRDIDAKAYLLDYSRNQVDDDNIKRVFVLDEIDFLLSKNAEVLYTLFQIFASSQKNMYLIGIANTIDLTSGILPLLRSRNINCDELFFKAYSALEISNIIMSRLKSLDVSQRAIIHPAAVQLCARKVAAVNGDIRRALDICRFAVEMVENEQSYRATGYQLSDEHVGISHGPANGRSPSQLDSASGYPVTSSPCRVLGELTLNIDLEEQFSLKKVTIQHVAKATSMLFDCSAPKARIDALSLHQKAVLCTFCCHSDSSAEETLSLEALYREYSRICKKDDLFTPVSLREFHDIIDYLEGQCLLKLIKQENVALNVPKIDICTSASKVELLKRFISI